MNTVDRLRQMRDEIAKEGPEGPPEWIETADMAADELEAALRNIGRPSVSRPVVAADLDAIEVAAKLAMQEIDLGEDPRPYLLKIVERCDELAQRLGDKLQ